MIFFTYDAIHGQCEIMGQEHDQEYQDMTMKDLNKEVTDMSKNSRA
jgi:cell division protein FtsL